MDRETRVKELRNRGDETARIILAHQIEGLEPPPQRRDFQYLLELIGDLYEKDPLNLELGLEYWCPDPITANESGYSYRPPPRQVALFKFVRLAGDLLPAPLFVPYLRMLIGLASSPQCAQHAFNLLKMNGVSSAGGSASSVSWDHFFDSLQQYYSNMRRESPAARDTMGLMYRSHPVRTITPQELEGLQTVLTLTRTVAEYHWSVVVILFGLLGCSVAVSLKRELLLTLAALSQTPMIAATVWQTLEASQVELEEIESRNEEYPMTLGFLKLLNTLTDVPIPPGLGVGLRAPGFDPYLNFIVDGVLLKFNARAYKEAGEKWEVVSAVLEILYKLLRDHEVSEENFRDELLELPKGSTVSASKPPGFTLLKHMLNDSSLFKMVMRILDDAIAQFDTYTNFPGRQWFVIFNSTLSHHALAAVKILYLVTQMAPIQFDLINLFTADPNTSEDLLHGFVECLDCDFAEEAEDSSPEGAEDEDNWSVGRIQNATRQHIVQLLLHCLQSQPPNLAHWLLGFQIQKSISKTSLQDPGPRCLQDTPRLAELAYHLIYQLCANRDTSAPTLRYLRTTHDFLFQQLRHLPFDKQEYSKQMRSKLLSILDTVSFSHQFPPELHFTFFNPKVIEGVLSSHEVLDAEGVSYYNVRALRRLLIAELNNQQGPMMAGQRPLIMEEITNLLAMVVERNGLREALHRERQNLEAWRQVVEVLLTACPEDLLSGERRQTVIFELLQELLAKCFLTDRPPLQQGPQLPSNTYISLLDRSVAGGATAQQSPWSQGVSSKTLFATSLQIVLKGLIEYILSSRSGLQRVRANLYETRGVERVLAGKDMEYEQLCQENLATISAFGEAFMEVVCRDACDGHDIGRMLALSVLDSIVAEDHYQHWLSFLITKGYLQHLAALKLCLAVLTSLGMENKEAASQVMLFVISHGDVFNTILRARSPSLDLAAMRELALTTAVIARANCQADLDAEFLDSVTAQVEFKSHRSRLHRQMMALLPRYCFSEKFNKQLRNLSSQTSLDNAADIALAYQEIATNITAFCRAVITESSPSYQYSRILFGPSLEEASARDLQNGEDLSNVVSVSTYQAPNLGVVVYQLRQCTSQFQATFDTHHQYQQKLGSLHDLSTEDLKQLSEMSGMEKLSSQQRQVVARQRLQQMVANKGQELQHLSYILENCLFIIWRHLEYYLLNCVPADQQPLGFQNPAWVQQGGGDLEGVDEDLEQAAFGVTRQDLDLLKKNAPAVISETLLKKVLEINQVSYAFCRDCCF
nr:hypothetical protein BaRGS_010217 [Batillaria attramentaria]